MRARFVHLRFPPPADEVDEAVVVLAPVVVAACVVLVPVVDETDFEDDVAPDDEVEVEEDAPAPTTLL